MFEFSEEQRELQRVVREFSRDVVEPKCRELDSSGEFPWDIAKQMAEMGLFKLAIPEDYGGIGLDSLTRAVIYEELSKVYAVTANVLAIHSTSVEMISRVGTEEQKARWFPSMQDETGMIATCITEPGAGSDAAAIKTRAVWDGGNYIINGTKSFVSGGGVARYYMIFASTNPEKRGNGISLFLVEKTAPGLSFGKPEDKMGMRALPICELYLDHVAVPAENRIGSEDAAFKVGMAALNNARLDAAAMSVGIAQGALDYALNYAKQRVQFGKPISEFQAVQFMLADMEIEIQAARSLLYQTCSMADKKGQSGGSDSFARMCAITKCFASEMVNRATSTALQVLGGAGYIKEHPVERMMRDARLWPIGDGTSQIQRLIISRQLLKEG